MALQSDALAAEVGQDHRRGLARQGADAEVAHERGDVGGVRGPGGAAEPEARERGAAPSARAPARVLQRGRPSSASASILAHRPRAARAEVPDAPVALVGGGPVRGSNVPRPVVPASAAVHAGSTRRGVLPAVGRIVGIRPVERRGPLPDAARHVEDAVWRRARRVLADRARARACTRRWPARARTPRPRDSDGRPGRARPSPTRPRSGAACPPSGSRWSPDAS